MVALLVLSILAYAAAPSFQPILRQNRLTTETNRIVTNLSHARNEAITRARSVGVCTSDNGADCDGSANWSNQFIVFSDQDGNGAPDPDEILRLGTKPADTTTITATAVPQPLFFTGRGFAAKATTGVPPIDGGAYLSVGIAGHSELTREICITRTGQIRSRNPGKDPAC